MVARIKSVATSRLKVKVSKLLSSTYEENDKYQESGIKWLYPDKNGGKKVLKLVIYCLKGIIMSLGEKKCAV
jgi:hypothetical protein